MMIFIPFFLHDIVAKETQLSEQFHNAPSGVAQNETARYSRSPSSI